MPVLFRWLWTIGPGNPIAVSLLRTASCRRQHLWVRCAYLGGLSLLAVMALLSSGSAGPTSLADLAKAGGWVFTVVAYTQVVVICLLAPLMMATAIGREDAQTTRDILHTTPLVNVQLVLGPLLGRLFMIWALLASGLPLFAILVVVGGVPVRAILVAFAVAGLSALMVGSVAVALSVFGDGSRRNVYGFVIITMALLVAGFAADRLLRDGQPRRTAVSLGLVTPAEGGATTVMTPLHPLLVLEASLGRPDYQPPTEAELIGSGTFARLYRGRPFAAFSLLTMVTSAVLVGVCGVRVRQVGEAEHSAGSFWRRLRRRSATNTGQKAEEVVALRAQTPAVGPGRGARERIARTVWANPVAWWEAHARGSRMGSQLGRWSFFAGGVLAIVVLLWLYHVGGFSGGSAGSGAGMVAVSGSDAAATLRAGVLAVLLLEVVVIVLVAVYVSAGSVSRERESGTLDLLLTTPITPKQYLWGKLRGLVSFLAVLLATPIVGLALVSVYTLVGLALQWPQARPRFELAGFGPAGTVGGGSVGTAAAGAARFPLMPPEVGLLFPLLLVPFVAFCVAVGMAYSVRARGVLGAVASTLGVVAVLGLIGGFCGLGAAGNIPVFGPILNGFNPGTALLMLVNPWQRVAGFASEPVTGRVGLAMAAMVAAGLYALIVKMLLAGMVRQFDQTVRRLSGAG